MILYDKSMYEYENYSRKAYVVKVNIDSVGRYFGKLFAEFSCFVVDDVIETDFLTPFSFLLSSNKSDHFQSLLLNKRIVN